MKILTNISLKKLTTMHVGGDARYFVEVFSAQDIISSLGFAKQNHLPFFILGGGSNTIFSDNGYPGLVIKVSLKGSKKIFEDMDVVHYRVCAGEKWDDFVRMLVGQNLYGLENLSHVPGLLGASVVQNIGCYGQEVSSCVVSVDAINTEDLSIVTFSKQDMGFGYRESRLNRQDRGKFVITSIIFELKKKSDLVISYNDIKKYYLDNPDISPNLATIRNAIISIRDSKFPFPDSPDKGSSGSFWNTEPINEERYENIIKILIEKGFQEKAREMENKKSVFKVDQGYKVPYGLFVEVLGFKGKKIGGAKILETHAGVINNFTGEAKASDVYQLSLEIIDSVYKEFGIKMNTEPELIGFDT